MINCGVRHQIPEGVRMRHRSIYAGKGDSIDSEERRLHKGQRLVRREFALDRLKRSVDGEYQWQWGSSRWDRLPCRGRIQCHRRCVLEAFAEFLHQWTSNDVEVSKATCPLARKPLAPFIRHG